ncbi:hypothetical protein Vretimale_403, partial [Volvox reticuliferus]
SDGPSTAGGTVAAAAAAAAAAAGGAGCRPPLYSVFGLPGAADETVAAIAATAAGDVSSTPTAMTSAAIGADSGSSPQRHVPRDHVTSLPNGTPAGSIVAVAAAGAAAAAPEPSVETSAPVGVECRHRLSGLGVDTGITEASASLLPPVWDGGESDGLRGSGHASSSVSVCGGAAGGGLGVGGGGSGLLRRAPTMTSRDRSRSRMLDEQFAALQLPDASGLLECPFASYAVRNATPGSEGFRRAPRESTSTAATTSPQASGVGYLTGAPVVGQLPRHAAATADGAGAHPMLAAVASAAVSPREMALPGFSVSAAMPLPSRRWEVPPLGTSPSPSDLAVGGHSDISGLSRLSRSPPWALGCAAADMEMGGVSEHENGKTGGGPQGDPPADPGNGHLPDQLPYTSELYGVGGFADAAAGAADSDIGSGVGFAFAGHLGLRDSSPADEPPSPSRPAHRGLGHGEAVEGDQVEVAVGQDVTVALGPATQKYEVCSRGGNQVFGGGSGGSIEPGVEVDEEAVKGDGDGDGVVIVGDGDDGEGDSVLLMSSSAPARFHVLALSGPGRRTGKVPPTLLAAPARSELLAGAQLETLDEEQDEHEHVEIGKWDEHRDEQSATIWEGGAGRSGGAGTAAASLLFAPPSLLPLQDGPWGSGGGGGGGPLFSMEIARASSASAMPIAAAAAAAAAGTSNASPFAALANLPSSPRGGASSRSYLAVNDCDPWAVSSADASITMPSGSLPSARLSASAAAPAADPVAAASNDGGNTVGGANSEGGQRRLSDPGSGPARRFRQSTSESRRSESTSAAASRRRRIFQSRMSPSFAIGVGVSGGATRHLSLNKAAAGGGGGGGGRGEAIASVISASPTTPGGAPWRLARQPSSRWFSVAATDAVRSQQRPKQQLQQLGRKGLEATARPTAVGSGSPAAAAAAAAAAVATAVGRSTSSPGRIAVAVAAEVAAGKGFGGGDQMSGSGGGAPHLLGRRWASLQELAGQQRALDAFCNRDEERRRGGGSSHGASGSTSGSGQSSGVRLGSEKAEVEELMVEYRIRLLAGFKRFFHEQALEGVLSPGGMRLLCHCCDDALHRPSAPLDLWSAVEREVVGRRLVQWQAWAHLALRRGMQRALRWSSPLYLPAKWLLLRPMRALAEVSIWWDEGREKGNDHLGKSWPSQPPPMSHPAPGCLNHPRCLTRDPPTTAATDAVQLPFPGYARGHGGGCGTRCGALRQLSAAAVAPIRGARRPRDLGGGGSAG